MSSALQNRLVGTIIVVALIVILLPELLDGEKRTNIQEFSTIPPVAQKAQVQIIQALETDKIRQQLQQPVEEVFEPVLDAEELVSGSENGAQAQSNVQTVESNSANQAGDKSTNKNALEAKLTSRSEDQQLQDEADTLSQQTLDSIDIKDSGWVVQLGSFKHEKNVKELLKTLNDAGYRAYSRSVKTNIGELNKVFVGPELDREKLELALPHLQEITRLKGKITAFEVSAE